MNKPTSLLIVDADLHGLETLTYGFEREACKVTRTSDLSRAVQLSRAGNPALATVMVRDPAPPALEVIAALREAHKQMPILALGDVALQTSARAAGASDFLRTPTYIRDVVNAGKLSAYDEEGEGLLSEYHGLFYLLRAMAATTRSCVLRLARGSQRAEIRFKDGKVTSANVRALQNLPALHHMLLWEEARVTIASGSVAKPNQFPLSAQEVLDECERFMRDFAHAARDLGPPNTVYRPVEEPRPVIPGMLPNQMVPLLRLFDGKHGLADVVEESPFRIFDTIRMIRRLVEGGVLSTRAPRRPTGPQQRPSRPVAPLNGTRSTGPQSMLGQWAMVPDQRGVVGDRRSPSRPLMPFGNRMFDQPGVGGDRRKPSRPVQPLARPAQPGPSYDQVPVTPGPTPLPTPAPIPLTVKKVPSGDVTAMKGEIDAAGEIPPVKGENGEIGTTASELPPPVKGETKGELDAIAADIPPVKSDVKSELDAIAADIPPVKGEVKSELDAATAADIPPVRPQSQPDGFAMALEPTVQVKVDADGTPLELPPVRPAAPPAAAAAPAPAPTPAPPVRRKTPTPSPALSAMRNKTPIPSRVTPAAAFDAVEADFFAREADLYKREAVDTFDDLDPMGGSDGAHSKTSRRRK
jgi:DNA-binding response OmpR family regulator